MTDYTISAPSHMEDQTVETVFPSRRARASRKNWTRWLEPSSLVPTFVGVLVVAAGFVLIGVAWAQIAGLTVVSLQMPYLVSAGFTGLALVMVGLVVVNVSAKRQDAAERARQMLTLTETFQSLQKEIARLNGTEPEDQ
jgi:hypothetical protein